MILHEVAATKKNKQQKWRQIALFLLLVMATKNGQILEKKMARTAVVKTHRVGI